MNDLWLDAFREAVAAGAVPRELIRASVERKLIKASLLDVADEVLAGQRPQEQPAAKVIQGKVSPDSDKPGEASLLRSMLWDSMIEAYSANRELNRIRKSVAWRLEDTLVRKPAGFGFDIAYRGVRKAYRMVRRRAA